MKQNDQPQTAGGVAVAKIFEPTKVLRERLAELMLAFDQVDRLGRDAASAFDAITSLANHLTQLAAAYAPVREFQSEVGALARDFEPMRGVQNQFAEMSQSFCDNLKQLALALEPAKKLQNRLAELADVFRPAILLQRQFDELAGAFDTVPHSDSVGAEHSGAIANGSVRAQ